MKYAEIINEVKELYPNEYSDSQYKKWLLELESLIAVYAGQNAPETISLNSETSLHIPFDRLYIDFLMAQVSLHQHDDESYTRYMQMYNSRYREWQNWFIRTHEGKKYRFTNWIL